LYGHLDRRLVKVNDRVKRGQHIGTIGTNHGMYLAHLHFEIRKNIAIGTNRSKFGRGYSNYHSPTSFIEKRRKLRASFRSHSIPIGFPDGSSSGNAIVIDVNSPPPPDATQAESSKLPTEVEKALRGVPEDKEKDTRGFWQKIKERLTFRFRKREDSPGSDFRRR
ncbi:MAG: M23 family metallopeptidase, partial [Verrucomicrobiales bacterium]